MTGASLLLNDIKSDLARFSKRKQNITSEKSELPELKPMLYDETFVQKIQEKSVKLKAASDTFVTMFNTELKISLPDTKATNKLLELDEESINILTSKCPQSKEVCETLLATF